MTLVPFLEGRDRIFVRQRKEWTEILVGWETRNQYEVLGEGGETIGRIAEPGGGVADHLKRLVLRSHRPLDVGVFDGVRQPVLRLARGFFFWFSDLSVERPDGSRIGSVERRFGLLYRRYDLKDERGRLFARIAGPRWRIWTFPVVGDDGRRHATIRKKWSGLLRETFSDADTFGIEFETADWSAGQRAVIFAAALSIDFDFFENNQRSGGLLGSGV